MRRFWAIARTTTFVAFGGTVFALVSFGVSYALSDFAPALRALFRVAVPELALLMGLNAVGSLLAATIHKYARAKRKPSEILELLEQVTINMKSLASISRGPNSTPILREAREPPLAEVTAALAEAVNELHNPQLRDEIEKEREKIDEAEGKTRAPAIQRSIGHALRLYSSIESSRQRRYFAVSLAGEAITKDYIIYVNCKLNLERPNDPSIATAPAEVDLSISSVSFICSVEGFDCLSPASLPVELPPGGDTKPVVFMLRVQEADAHRITISAYQNGVIRGQVVVDDPKALLAARPASHQNLGMAAVPGDDSIFAGASRFYTARLAPSVSLDFIGPTANVVGNSPHDCFNWNAKDLGPWRENAMQVMSGVRDHIAGLYSTPPAPDEIDREFAVLGTRITNVLPEKLVDALRDKTLSLASIQVPRSFDFPIDLCWIDGEHVQERIATARWFTNTRAIRLNCTHRISNIALVLGKMKETSQVEEGALAHLKPASFQMIDTRKDLIDLVFKTNNFDFLHYFGHCGRGEPSGANAGRFLSLAKDTRTFRLSDLGLLEEERAFFHSAPFVVLNCCDGTDASDLFDGNDSFPHRFIDNASVAFVGALWPVDSRAANRFVTEFYKRLGNSAFVAQALHGARKHILEEARKPETSARDRLFLTLAARSYVYYGPPDLRCIFKQGAVAS